MYFVWTISNVWLWITLRMKTVSMHGFLIEPDWNGRRTCPIVKEYAFCPQKPDSTTQYQTLIQRRTTISKYAGVLEMAQKVIEGGFVTWRHMHEILRRLNFKLAQNLDHVSKLRDGSFFQTWNSEMAQNSKHSISRIEFLFEFWAISEF